CCRAARSAHPGSCGVLVVVPDCAMIMASLLPYLCRGPNISAVDVVPVDGAGDGLEGAGGAGLVIAWMRCWPSSSESSPRATASSTSATWSKMLFHWLKSPDE